MSVHPRLIPEAAVAAGVAEVERITAVPDLEAERVSGETPEGFVVRAVLTAADAFYDMVEQVSPGPYFELARRARFGWDYAGDGSLGTVDVPGLRAPGVAA